MGKERFCNQNLFFYFVEKTIFDGMKKKLKELLLLKDASVKKVQFDKIWFFDLKDMQDYLEEDLSEVETVHLPFMVDGEPVNTKCATIEDIERVRREKAGEKNI